MKTLIHFSKFCTSLIQQCLKAWKALSTCLIDIKDEMLSKLKGNPVLTSQKQLIQAPILNSF